MAEAHALNDRQREGLETQLRDATGLLAEQRGAYERRVAELTQQNDQITVIIEHTTQAVEVIQAGHRDERNELTRRVAESERIRAGLAETIRRMHVTHRGIMDEAERVQGVAAAEAVRTAAAQVDTAVAAVRAEMDARIRAVQEELDAKTGASNTFEADTHRAIAMHIAENARQKQEIDTLRGGRSVELDTQAATIAGLTREVEGLKRAMAAHEAEKQTMIQALADARNDLSVVRVRALDARTEADRFKALIDVAKSTAEASVTRSAAEVADIKREIMRIEEEKRRMEGALQTATTQLADIARTHAAQLNGMQEAHTAEVGELGARLEAETLKVNTITPQLITLQVTSRYALNTPEPKWIAMVTTTPLQAACVKDMLEYFSRICRIDSSSRLNNLQKLPDGTGNYAPDKFGWFRKEGLVDNTVYYVQSDVVRVLFLSAGINPAVDAVLATTFNNTVLPLGLCPASLFVVLYERRTNEVIKPYLLSKQASLLPYRGASGLLPTDHYKRWPFAPKDLSLDFYPGFDEWKFAYSDDRYIQLFELPTKREKEFVAAPARPVNFASEFFLDEEEDLDWLTKS